MNKRAANILTALLLTATLTAPAAAQSVRLRATASIADRRVRLADVAAVADLPEETGRVVVCELPENARSARLDMAQVETALRRAGVNPAPVDFSGAARCRLRLRPAAAPIAEPTAKTETTTTPVKAAPTAQAAKNVKTAAAAVEAPATIGEQILRQAAGDLGAPIEQVRVTFGRPYETTVAMAPEGVVALHSSDRRLLGRRRWRVDFGQGQRRYRRYVVATVSVTRPVVTTVRALLAGTTIAAGDVRLTERADDGDGELMTDLASVVGQKLRRPLAADAPVRADTLTAPILVQRGQTVWITCGAVRLPVKALERGGKGDRIQVENPRGGGRFSATVVAAGKATLALASTTPQREAN